MFVDEETENFLRNSSALDSSKKIGLWRIVLVRNLPYTDPRRNGKVEIYFFSLYQYLLKPFYSINIVE